jgi:hypothetical protein
LLDTHLNYQDDSYREFRDTFTTARAISSARFVPSRTILASVTLSF